MGITGIFINHPSLLSSLSVPASWLGTSYQYDNWNRFSFRDSLLLDDDSLFIGGKMGVFFSPDASAPFQDMNKGLPESFYLRDIGCLLVVERGGETQLFAGGRGGLFFRKHKGQSWQRVATVGEDEIVDVVQFGDRILAFSAHRGFSAPVSPGLPVFKEVPLQIDTVNKRIPGYRLLFELHSGKLFGLPGRLLVDFSALVLLFLSLSAFYLWVKPLPKRWFARMYSWHLFSGIWLAAFLFLIAGTGSLIRPPLIVLSSFWQVPFSWLMQENPEIVKAAVTHDGSLVLATRDGWYKGDVGIGSPLKPVTPPLPVFGMGATVLKTLHDNELLVGSFSGLFTWNPDNDFALDMEGNTAVDTGQVRPGDVMVAGAIVRDGRYVNYVDYKTGLMGTGGRPFPEKLLSKRTSLYHFLFELHNGRFLRDIIGSFYILYVPLVGLALMLVVFTGSFDWLKRKINCLRRCNRG